jgi:lysine 6-dehydrogenase
MKIAVLGSGLMGPAAAYNALNDRHVEQVLLCDKDPAALDHAVTALARSTDTGRLVPVALDLADVDSSAAVLAPCNVILGALPTAIVAQGLRVAVQARTPWVDLAFLQPERVAELEAPLREAGIFALLGCGLEPGLTEILARALAGRMDSVHELHIKCGGIPDTPSGPLNYRIVFGGQRLPFHEDDGYKVEEGQLRVAPRYGDVERFEMEGIGELEAWNENFMPWLLSLKEMKGLRTGTQKTVRWPGYADKVRALKELGLLGELPVQVGDVAVAPKALVDAVLVPQTSMRPEDRDISLLRVDVQGERKGRLRHERIEMVDRYDEKTGLTAMARTTAFTGMIIARMAARKEIRGEGILTCERVITGKRLTRLLRELADAGIHFTLIREQRRAYP